MPITDAIPEMKRDLRFFPVSNKQPSKLTRKQVQHFNEKGYVFPLDVFNEEEVKQNRYYFDDMMDRALAAGWNSYSINGWQRQCKGIYDLAMETRILDYVQDLVGGNLVCTMTHYFCKLSGDTKQVAWHQDASYWPLTPSKVVTVWLAIDDVDEDNGPMTVIPGSHLHGIIPFEHSTKEENNVLGQTVQGPDKWGDAPVPFVMQAGQISMHTDMLLHGSAPNLSDRRRCGLTLRYNPPEVRGDDSYHSYGMICRGSDPDGYWRHQPRPETDEVPQRQR